MIPTIHNVSMVGRSIEIYGAFYNLSISLFTPEITGHRDYSVKIVMMPEYFSTMPDSTSGKSSNIGILRKLAT